MEKILGEFGFIFQWIDFSDLVTHRALRFLLKGKTIMWKRKFAQQLRVLMVLILQMLFRNFAPI